ncbi:MAG: 3-deoxy-manno-octulosonate cytidylyltransferase [Bacteroidales bacterium]
MKTLAIIPARYNSTRLPGKPLMDIKGKTMIQRVYEQVQACSKLDSICVATDDMRIFTHVQSFGGNVCMTSSDIANGTARCLAAFSVLQKQQNIEADVIVNIQGDEPFISPLAIESLLDCFENDEVEIATLTKKIQNVQQLMDPNVVKLVKSKNNWALYFSRQAIPYNRAIEDKNLWLTHSFYYKHIGLYAYRPHILEQLVQLAPSSLEEVEKLEQLRWIENDFRIFAKETMYESISVDTMEDLEYIIKNIA